mmetsp:Transcript_49100/g.123479  ORF Transcript_49100/g.123479 Transcript_49100/m.123479 type:complete len:129 (+) Transcript_49100:270-656(+)|eukprot:CAMPEP_0177634892 /NCGR_PEP_ID=MMETSP0447-20121125/3607_1 /TAXON_ID=0 /ORGANISM="Stygamoeba regulata, Strain BSH-02190019" /LENGTH=128 /DNA_ID=CAMNT_0019136637 /DNA_START=386 /DNA_END=772 /DNA_ORIENTATION=-
MRFLVANDGSVHGVHALQRALSLIDAAHDELFVLAIGQNGSQASELALDSNMEATYSMCTDAQVKPCILWTEATDPGVAICESAVRHEVDLVVLGGRGHSTLHRVLVGSTSDYVMNNSAVSVMITCPP